MREVGPLTSVTLAPAPAAASASAYPMRPELWLLMKRTGSSGSRVGPAVTSTPSPSSSPLARRRSVTIPAMRAGSSILPGPISPHAWIALIRTQEQDTATGERRDVVLRGRMQPHLSVHRRRRRHRSLGGEAQGREQVVGHALPEPGEEMRGGGSDEDQVRPPRELDVPHRRFRRRVEEIHAHRVTGHRLKRERRDEVTPPPESSPPGPSGPAHAGVGQGRDFCRRRCRRSPRPLSDDPACRA